MCRRLVNMVVLLTRVAVRGARPQRPIDRERYLESRGQWNGLRVSSWEARRSGKGMKESGEIPAGRALGAGVGWVATTYALEQWGAYLVPAALKPMALETFGTLRQLVATAVGLALCHALVRRPAPLLGVTAPSPHALAQTALAAPRSCGAVASACRPGTWASTAGS
jgi:hypothetical protein